MTMHGQNHIKFSCACFELGKETWVPQKWRSFSFNRKAVRFLFKNPVSLQYLANLAAWQCRAAAVGQLRRYGDGAPWRDGNFSATGAVQVAGNQWAATMSYPKPFVVSLSTLTCNTLFTVNCPSASPTSPVALFNEAYITCLEAVSG